ncbi:MAG: XRE family transcriptional regulator [Bacteroidia bacterium]|nr:XRE family transcriptional regulator [Bacteroidia bacterium]
MNKLFAERIRSARIMSGLSLQGLADKIGNKISRQAIHKYEKGDSIPDSEMLGILCEALKIRPDYFTRETSIDLGPISFRKIEKLPLKNQNSIVETTREILSRHIELEDIVGSNEEFNNPLSAVKINSLEDVEIAVNKLRTDWGMDDNPIRNVIELLEDKNIKVLEIETDDEFDGLQTWVKSGRIPVIVLNSDEKKPKDRKRFTALHELGHLLLPLEGISEKMAEKYCHAFAGAMLFPKKAALDSLGNKRTKLSIQELGILKQQYGISIQAILYRAYNIGIISESYKNYFFKYITEMGWRIEEPFELAGAEVPVRFNQMLYRALSEEQISISKAAALKNMKLAEFRSKMMIAG